MKVSYSTAVVTAALLASTGLTTPAIAQAGEQPPQRQTLDENGVNPATGAQITYYTRLSIGPEGRGGLHLVSGRGHGINQSTMTFVISGNPAIEMYATAGLRTVTFKKVSGSFQSADGSDAKLVQNSSSQYTLTLEDGTVVVYNELGGDTLYDGRASSVTYPTGEKLTFAYRTVEYCSTIEEPCPGTTTRSRLQGIASSSGYLFHYDYTRTADPVLPQQGSSWSQLANITAINTTVDPCAVSALTCTTTQTWPTLADNPWVFVDSPTQFKVRRPGSAVDNVVVNIDTTTQRTTSVVRDGMTWTYAWSLGGATLTRTDPLSHTMTVVSNLGLGVPTSVTDELGRVTTHEYDTSGRLMRTIFPEGNKVEYAYDGRGNVTQSKRVAKVGSGLADIVTSASYPATCPNIKSCNLPTTTTDARGKVTDYTWNANGDPLTVTLPTPTTGAVRPQTRYSYTSVATVGGQTVTRLLSESQCQTLAICSGAADEAKSTLTWSSQLFLTGTTQANGTGTLSATTAFGPDTRGNVRTIDGPLTGSGDTTTLRYDNPRRVVGEISPDPDGAGALKRRAVRTTYNVDGTVQKAERGTVNGTTDPDWAAMIVLETQSITYDSAARPVTAKIAGSDGIIRALTQQSYDGEGRLDCSTIRMNSAIYASLPSSACTIGTEGSFGPDRISKTIYNAANEVTELRESVATPVEAAERTLTYTNNSQLQTLKDAENNLTTYEYDGHDRLSKTRFPVSTKGANQSSTTDYELLTYDVPNNLIARRQRDGNSIIYAFDALDRLTGKDLPGTEPDVTNGYDNLGRLTASTQSSHTLSFTYDALSRNLAQVGPKGTVTFAYDVAGRRSRMTWPDAFFVDYDYLVTGEVTKLRENGATSGIGVLAIYAYDDLRRRSSLTLGNGAVTSYGYDPVSRLSSLTSNLAGSSGDLTLGMNHNPASQITSQARSNDAFAWTGHGSGTTASVANGLNQLTSAGATNFTYDAKGNLAGDGTNIYSYFAENQLRAKTVGGVSAFLTYDPLGRLYAITGSQVSDRFFLYDGTSAIAEYTSGGGMFRRNVLAPGIDEALLHYDNAGVRTWYSADERGSIISQSNDSGAYLRNNTYDEYGRPGSTNSGRFQYTGQMWLHELGLYHYKARAYAPELGRFLQSDPTGYVAGPNLYVYVRNDPINLVDPDGKRAMTIGEQRRWKDIFGPLTKSWYVAVNEGWDLPSKTAVTWSHKTIAFAFDMYSDDFSKESVMEKRATFWHEVYHAFELKIGLVSWERLALNITTGNYSYNYDRSKSFMDNGPEARAAYFGRCMATGTDCSALEGFSARVDNLIIKFSGGQFNFYAVYIGSRIPRRVWPVKTP